MCILQERSKRAGFAFHAITCARVELGAHLLSILLMYTLPVPRLPGGVHVLHVVY